MGKAQAARESGSFLALEMNGCHGDGRAGKSAPRLSKVAHRRHRGKKAVAKSLVDAVINGERVLLAELPPDALEKEIEIHIRAALNAAGIMCMKHHVDMRSTFGRGLGVGVADLVCVVRPYGRFLAIEVKRPGYSPSDVRPEQTKWMAVVRRYGGIAGIATSVEEAFRLVDLARRLP